MLREQSFVVRDEEEEFLRHIFGSDTDDDDNDDDKVVMKETTTNHSVGDTTKTRRKKTTTKKRKRSRKTEEEKNAAEREKIRKKKIAKIRSVYDKEFRDANKKTKSMVKRTKKRMDDIEKKEKELNEELLPIAVAIRQFKTRLKPFQMKSDILPTDSVQTLNMYKTQIVDMFKDVCTVVEESNKLKTHIIQENSKTLQKVANFGKKLDQLKRAFLNETAEVFTAATTTNTNSNRSKTGGGYGALPEITCPTCYELNNGVNLTLLDSIGVDYPFVEQDKLRGVPKGGLITSPLDYHRVKPKKRVKKGSAVAAQAILNKQPTATEMLSNRQRQRQTQIDQRETQQ